MPKMCAIPQLVSPPLDPFIIYSHYVPLPMSRNIVFFGYIMVCMRHEMYISCGFSLIQFVTNTGSVVAIPPQSGGVFISSHD